jgi:hypothetical protein
MTAVGYGMAARSDRVALRSAVGQGRWRRSVGQRRWRRSAGARNVASARTDACKPVANVPCGRGLVLSAARNSGSSSSAPAARRASACSATSGRNGGLIRWPLLKERAGAARRPGQRAVERREHRRGAATTTTRWHSFTATRSDGCSHASAPSSRRREVSARDRQGSADLACHDRGVFTDADQEG